MNWKCDTCGGSSDSHPEHYSRCRDHGPNHENWKMRQREVHALEHPPCVESKGAEIRKLTEENKALRRELEEAINDPAVLRAEVERLRADNLHLRNEQPRDPNEPAQLCPEINPLRSKLKTGKADATEIFEALDLSCTRAGQLRTWGRDQKHEADQAKAEIKRLTERLTCFEITDGAEVERLRGMIDRVRNSLHAFARLNGHQVDTCECLTCRGYKILDGRSHS